jgi:hypothetical protein
LAIGSIASLGKKLHPPDQPYKGAHERQRGGRDQQPGGCSEIDIQKIANHDATDDRAGQFECNS